MQEDGDEGQVEDIDRGKTELVAGKYFLRPFCSPNIL
jgi:hypothetical protein